MDFIFLKTFKDFKDPWGNKKHNILQHAVTLKSYFCYRVSKAVDTNESVYDYITISPLISCHNIMVVIVLQVL